MGMLRKSCFVLTLVLVCMMVMSGCAKKKGPAIEPVVTEEEEEVKKKLDPNLPFDQRRYARIDDLENIYFDFDKSIIKTEEREVLEKNAQWLKDNPDEEILVEGHCDERGTEEYNIALGERRAEVTRKYYRALGIDRSRIEVLSWGEERPADPRHNEGAWSKNRRAETLIRVE